MINDIIKQYLIPKTIKTRTMDTSDFNCTNLHRWCDFTFNKKSDIFFTFNKDQKYRRTWRNSEIARISTLVIFKSAALNLFRTVQTHAHYTCILRKIIFTKQIGWGSRGDFSFRLYIKDMNPELRSLNAAC